MWVQGVESEGHCVSDYTHMRRARSPKNPSPVRACVSSLLLYYRCKDSIEESPDPPHQQKCMGQAAISPLSLSLWLIHMHKHTLMHRHSHIVSSMSAASQQQVSEDRGHLCAGLPLLSSASVHLCWGKTGREERADRLPLSSTVHTTKTHNFFNQNASALASWSLFLYLPLLSACGSKYL